MRETVDVDHMQERNIWPTRPFDQAIFGQQCIMMQKSMWLTVHSVSITPISQEKAGNKNEAYI